LPLFCQTGVVRNAEKKAKHFLAVSAAHFTIMYIFRTGKRIYS
jgi:hypothetical protein